MLLLLVALPASAHKGSDAYWTLRASGPVVSGRVEVALKDLEVLVGLDADGDGKVTWGEVKAKDAAVRTALTGALGLGQRVGLPSPSQGEGGSVDSACPLSLGEFSVTPHSDGMYLSVPVTARCAANVSELEVKYALLFDVDAQHRGLVSVSGETGGNWTAFTNNRRAQTLTFTSIGAGEQTGLAFFQGVHHIAIGWDHLCFLFALLLPSVLRRAGTDWVPRPAFKPTLLDVTKVVTAFTVAHSITLALAAFGFVTPNAKWVEVAIAISVALAAFNNLVPFVPETRWSLAFSLGLMHGFGFVAAIRDLGAAGPSLWLSVLGFNLGVEAGQLGIVAVFVPLAWLLRTKPAYRRFLMPLGSALILGIALWWTAQRL
ncbi:MAG: HupE/UreJ family protein [Archangium sp.]|nr:HupE/UreJ family protein [Archangium sp.]